MIRTSMKLITKSTNHLLNIVMETIVQGLYALFMHQNALFIQKRLRIKPIFDGILNTRLSSLSHDCHYVNF